MDPSTLAMPGDEDQPVVSDGHDKLVVGSSSRDLHDQLASSWLDTRVSWRTHA
jgi:hypothetical protein